jgi:hypothetical protein
VHGRAEAHSELNLGTRERNAHAVALELTHQERRYCRWATRAWYQVPVVNRARTLSKTMLSARSQRKSRSHVRFFQYA